MAKSYYLASKIPATIPPAEIPNWVAGRIIREAGTEPKLFVGVLPDGRAMIEIEGATLSDMEVVPLTEMDRLAVLYAPPGAPEAETIRTKTPAVLERVPIAPAVPPAPAPPTPPTGRRGGRLP